MSFSTCYWKSKSSWTSSSSVSYLLRRESN